MPLTSITAWEGLLGDASDEVDIFHIVELNRSELATASAGATADESEAFRAAGSENEKACLR